MVKFCVVIGNTEKKANSSKRRQECQTGINIILQIQIIDEIRESKTKRYPVFIERIHSIKLSILLKVSHRFNAILSNSFMTLKTTLITEGSLNNNNNKKQC